jgi:hypothetical protein
MFIILVYSHPNAKDYRYAPILLFDKPAHAFGKDRATGKGDAPHADNVDEINKENEEQDNDEENESKRKTNNKE